MAMGYATFSLFSIGNLPVKHSWVCLEESNKKHYWMGADNVAATLWYLFLLKMGLGKLVIPIALFDIAVHGPQLSGAIGSSYLLWLALL